MHSRGSRGNTRLPSWGGGVRVSEVWGGGGGVEHTGMQAATKQQADHLTTCYDTNAWGVKTCVLREVGGGCKECFL
jgi:hypothetical protein